jgi:hypothetical protein
LLEKKAQAARRKLYQDGFTNGMINRREKLFAEMPQPNEPWIRSGIIYSKRGLENC